MRVRALSVLIACAIATAPSLVVACQVACAAAEATRSGVPVEHACHHEEAPEETAVLATVHGCSHDDGELATSGEKVSPGGKIAAAVAVFILDQMPVLRVPIPTTTDGRARPPDRSLTHTQLRI
jgi:hypothetical protein